MPLHLAVPGAFRFTSRKLPTMPLWRGYGGVMRPRYKALRGACPRRTSPTGTQQKQGARTPQPDLSLSPTREEGQRNDRRHAKCVWCALGKKHPIYVRREEKRTHRETNDNNATHTPEHRHRHRHSHSHGTDQPTSNFYTTKTRGRSHEKSSNEKNTETVQHTHPPH